MAKCIFDKKSHLKGYRRCEITNQIKRYKCYDNAFKFRHPCKHLRVNFMHRFLYWLGEKFEWN